MTRLGPYAALDHNFVVEVANGDDPQLDALFAPLGSSDASDAHVYRMGLPAEGATGWVEVGDERLEKDERGALHELLLNQVGVAAVEQLRDPVIHGCLVEHRGRGLLAAGQSRSGKSTFTARLLADGGALVTEDLTALRPDGSVRPFPRPVALSAQSLEALGLPVPDDDCGCGCMKHPLRPADLGGGIAVTAPVDVLLLCDCCSLRTEEITLPVALARLFDEASLGNVEDPDELALVARALARARCISLGTAELDPALDALEAVLAASPPRPPVEVAAERVGQAIVLYLDGEALIRVRDRVHHLDAVATAVWVLHTEGLSVEQVAAELDGPTEVVAATLDRLRELELTALAP
jgi:hypothetical protein